MSESTVNYTLPDYLLSFYAVVNPFNVPSKLMNGEPLLDLYFLAPIGVGVAFTSMGYVFGGYYWLLLGAWILPGLMGFARNMNK